MQSDPQKLSYNTWNPRKFSISDWAISYQMKEDVTMLHMERRPSLVEPLLIWSERVHKNGSRWRICAPVNWELWFASQLVPDLILTQTQNSPPHINETNNVIVCKFKKSKITLITKGHAESFFDFDSNLVMGTNEV